MLTSLNADFGLSIQKMTFHWMPALTGTHCCDAVLKGSGEVKQNNSLLLTRCNFKELKHTLHIESSVHNSQNVLIC